MTKVYGYSDDLVAISGSSYKEDEIGCFNKDVRIRFTDGTAILVGYPKHLMSGEKAGIWGIEIEKKGTAIYRLEICDDENADLYSDVFYINAEIKSHSVIKKRDENNDRQR